MGLTKLRIEKLTKRGLYRDERTLYLSVSMTGSKSWIQRIVVDGKRRDLGLGSYELVPLDEAREKSL